MIRRNSFFWLVPMILITSMMGLCACGGGGGSSGGSNSSGGISCTLTGTVMTGSNPISGVVVTLFDADVLTSAAKLDDDPPIDPPVAVT